MRKTFAIFSVAILALAVAAPLADGRGGGPGGGGGRGGGPGGGGRAGGITGGRGGLGGLFGSGGRLGGQMGQGLGANRFTGNRGNQSDNELQELEDRKALIAERRARLAEGDRAANQEARLAAERLVATADALGFASF